MLKGFTPPFTPGGRSSLVPPLPWHFAGQVLSLAFDLERAVAQDFLPGGFGQATGTAYGHFCEWQATTDGSELLDPVYAQYKEFFVLIEAQSPHSDERALFCPMIWVDQDVSMARGLLQGWPKKMGQVWMTRSYPIDHPAAARRQAGSRLGASLAVKDRRLASASVTLDGGDGRPLGFLGLPTFGLLGGATIVKRDDPPALRIVRARATSVSGKLMRGTAELEFLDGPRDELSALRPIGAVEASVGDFALTVTGAEEARPW